MIAPELGVSVGAVWRWLKTDVTNVSPKVFHRMLDVFKVSADDLKIVEGPTHDDKLKAVAGLARRSGLSIDDLVRYFESLRDDPRYSHVSIEPPPRERGGPSKRQDEPRPRPPHGARPASPSRAR